MPFEAFQGGDGSGEVRKAEVVDTIKRFKKSGKLQRAVGGWEDFEERAGGWRAWVYQREGDGFIAGKVVADESAPGEAEEHVVVAFDCLDNVAVLVDRDCR